MIFKQVFDTKSSTYTYLIASAKGREAIIIDPVIENVDDYIKLLNKLDLKLVKVIDTHIHADHVTGASKLKQATNCTTLMGEHTPADTVEIKVKDGEMIDIDNLKIKSLMIKNPFSVEKNTLASEVLAQMNKRKITNACVHSKGNNQKTIGVLHIHDLLNNLR